MGTVFVALIVAVLVLCAVFYLVQSKKKGKNSCGLNCSSCSASCGSGSCAAAGRVLDKIEESMKVKK